MLKCNALMCMTGYTMQDDKGEGPSPEGWHQLAQRDYKSMLRLDLSAYYVWTSPHMHTPSVTK